MGRWDFIKGKTLDEANTELKNLGYFVSEEEEQMFYQNAIMVRMENGKIVKVVGIGGWINKKDEQR